MFFCLPVFPMLRLLSQVGGWFSLLKQLDPACAPALPAPHSPNTRPPSSLFFRHHNRISTSTRRPPLFAMPLAPKHRAKTNLCCRMLPCPNAAVFQFLCGRSVGRSSVGHQSVGWLVSLQKEYNDGAKIQFSPQNHSKNHPKIHPGKCGVGLECVTVSQLSVIPREPPGSTPKKSCLNPLQYVHTYRSYI
jgi:hypothetical protein